jgi:hypothetical protein
MLLNFFTKHNNFLFNNLYILRPHLVCEKGISLRK